MLKTELPTIERYRKIVDDVPRAEKFLVSILLLMEKLQQKVKSIL